MARATPIALFFVSVEKLQNENYFEFKNLPPLLPQTHGRGRNIYKSWSVSIDPNHIGVNYLIAKGGGGGRGALWFMSLFWPTYW